MARSFVYLTGVTVALGSVCLYTELTLAATQLVFLMWVCMIMVGNRF